MLILAASNGKNLELARQVAEASRDSSPEGTTATVLDLVELGLPLFTPPQQVLGAGPGLALLADALREHRRLWVCAPEYNGSIPPTLVNALAWLSTSTDDFRSLFQGIPVALASHSGGSGHKVLSAMRLQLAHLGAVVIGRDLHSTPQRWANPDSIRAMLAELHRLEAPPLG